MIPRPEDYPHWIAWRDAVKAHQEDGAPQERDYDDVDAWLAARRTHIRSRNPFADRRSAVSLPRLSELSETETEQAVDTFRMQRDHERDEWFYETWHVMDAQREASALAEGDSGPDTSASLPLPTALGGPEESFGVAVDAYTAGHGVSRAETFRRISAITGNAPGGLALRYSQRYGDVWRFAAPL